MTDFCRLGFGRQEMVDCATAVGVVRACFCARTLRLDLVFAGRESCVGGGIYRRERREAIRGWEAEQERL